MKTYQFLNSQNAVMMERKFPNIECAKSFAQGVNFARAEHIIQGVKTGDGLEWQFVKPEELPF